jgi:lipopolysaccharide transport system ATP-binding protein
MPASRPVTPAPVDEDAGDPTLDASLTRVFRFDPERAGFGDGRAVVRNVRFEDAAGKVLTQVAGGELVRLVVEARAVAALESPIAGFFLKDKLGQQLFGKNTWRDGHAASPVDAGGDIRAEFEFRMPYLPRGRYTVDVALADGSHLDHVQAAWIYDAVALESVTSTVSTGLVGLPFRSVTLETRDGRG